MVSSRDQSPRIRASRFALRRNHRPRSRGGCCVTTCDTVPPYIGSPIFTCAWARQAHRIECEANQRIERKPERSQQHLIGTGSSEYRPSRARSLQRAARPADARAARPASCARSSKAHRHSRHATLLESADQLAAVAASGSRCIFGNRSIRPLMRGDHLLLRDVHAETLMRSESKAEVILRLAEQIVDVRILPARRIAIRSTEAQIDTRTGRQSRRPQARVSCIIRRGNVGSVGRQRAPSSIARSTNLRSSRHASQK